VPSRFEDGVLTLEFDTSAKAHIFERSGRVKQIEALLSREFSTNVRIKFEIVAGQTQTESGTNPPKTGSQRRNEIVNDPAVKTVLMGLDATITNIEEN